MRKYKIYSEKIRKQVRRLARKGVLKIEISKITGVGYITVQSWTRGIGKGKGYVRIMGPTLKTLSELVAKGYVFCDARHNTNDSYKTLRKYFPMKKAESHGIAMIYLDGSGRRAMEAFLERKGWRSLSWQRLADLRRIFGIKSMKRNNKMMGRLSE